MLGSRKPAATLNIVDRPITKNKLEIPTVSLSAFAFLFSEVIQYTMDRASSTGDLEDRLDKVGFQVGVRVLELLSYREKTLRRKPEILDILRFIHGTAWSYLFGKTADDLQQAAAADDEYMITDYDLLVNRYISVPKSYGHFNPGAVVAGILATRMPVWVKREASLAADMAAREEVMVSEKAEKDEAAAELSAKEAAIKAEATAELSA
eukprot:gene23018-30211_t